MKNSLRPATILADASIGWFCTCLSYGQTVPASAPASSAAAPRSSVAVVDISYIFKNHTRFKQQMEGMKGQVKEFEDQLRKRHQAIAQMKETLGEHRPGTPDYKRIEEEIARIASQLQVDTQLKRKEFLEREARVYYNVYTEITNMIAYFAERHSLSLVLRFNSEKIDPQDRQQVLQGVNRAVVFQKNLNITYEVLDRLNRGTPPPVVRREAGNPGDTIPR